MKLGICLIKSSIFLKTNERRPGHVACSSDFQSERSESQLAESPGFRYHVYCSFLHKKLYSTLSTCCLGYYSILDQHPIQEEAVVLL